VGSGSASLRWRHANSWAAYGYLWALASADTRGLLLTSSQHRGILTLKRGIAMSFGKRIKELRTERGLTQRQLAELTHVDFTYLSKIENDRLEHTPSIKTLQDLARALKVDELELMQLANKLPAAFNALAKDKDARRFFRRATATIKGPEGWRDLLNYLERKQSR
jgi:transcriptional regulator with XRE-family HTH domain